jgi:hypothetical protein
MFREGFMNCVSMMPYQKIMIAQLDEIWSDLINLMLVDF